MTDLAVVNNQAAEHDGIGEAQALRAACRSGAHDSVMTGRAPGMVQANLVILPADWADEFGQYCALNPKPCPLLAASAPGDPSLPNLGEDIDVRTDLPRYLVFRDGVEVDEVTDIQALWQDDFVAFALGCSYSFEGALLDGGLAIRHQDLGVKATVYLTSIETNPVGRLQGPMIVSMRPFLPADAIRAIEITSRCEKVHGAPVHFGDPTMIGIDDLNEPLSGPPPVLYPGEVPLFWACGVTPQTVIQNARPPIAIVHKPGHMLVTDIPNAALAN